MKYLRMIFFIFLLAGCSSQGMRESSVAQTENASFDGTGGQNGTESRIIIKNASIRMTVDVPADVSGKIIKLCEKQGGYVVSSSESRITLRIKSADFSRMIDLISKLGEVDSKRIYSRDVTESYLDSKIRLENKVKSRERYLQLLKKAENVTAAVRIERELERLNGEIESFKGKLKRMKHLSDFSTITVVITKKNKPGPLGYIFWGAYKIVKWLFVWD